MRRHDWVNTVVQILRLGLGTEPVVRVLRRRYVLRLVRAL